VKVGDLVKLSSEYRSKPMITDKIQPQQEDWRGIVLRQAPLIGGLMDGEEEDEWVIHWLHHPVGEECFEYGYYLEVVSASR